MRALLELTKPGITRLVVITAAAGFFLAMQGVPDLALFIHAMLGTALVAGGTNALNQWWERDVDVLMRRTRGRPLPSGRLAAAPALVFGVGISLLGVLELVWFVNLITAVLAVLTLLSYVLVYTPLKRRSTVATLVGAVPGALPILGGWTAAGGSLEPVAWVLFAILFLWQVPHFLSLGWLYREDYRRAGFQMLSLHDSDGFASGRQALLYTLVLITATVVPTLWGLMGLGYLVVALGLGGALLWCGVAFAKSASAITARRLFLASIVYLPVLLAVMVVDKLVG